MAYDSIEFVDRDYSIAKKDRISSTQIKTRQSSFNSISNVWRGFRLSSYQKLLDMKKNSLVNGTYSAENNGKLSESANKKLIKKPLAIAKLEQKIKILSDEVVPTNYVNNRAIKIRKKMMDNLQANCKLSYTVNEDSHDEIFENESNLNNIVESDSITSALDNAMNAVNVENNVNVPVEEAVEDKTVIEATEVSPVAEVPVEEVVTNEEVAEDNSVIEATEVSPVAEVPTEEVVTNEEVADDNTVIEATEVNPVAEVSTDEVVTNEEVAEDNSVIEATEVSPVAEVPSDDTVFDFDSDEALFEITTNGDHDSYIQPITDIPVNYSNDVNNETVISDDTIKVSKNNSSIAKIDKYKNEENKFEYKPMTAEEIEEAKRNIEYDNEKVYSSERKKVPVITFSDIFKPVSQEKREALYESFVNQPTNPSYTLTDNNDRYVPLIVPERNTEVKSYSNDVYKNDSSSISDINDMKEQYLKLQKLLNSKTAKYKSINQQREDIISRVADSDKDVSNANELLRKKRMMMERYINDIQEKCNALDSETNSLEEEINMSRKHLEENKQIVNSTHNTIDEIDQLLSENYYDSEEETKKRIA